ncbi:MAG: GTP-binding protein [Myxococcota bacterium]
MKLTTAFRTEDIRNIALIGGSSTGKTTLAEALLLRSGAIARLGSVKEETTVADFEPEAHRRHYSTQASLLFGLWEGKELNIIDTPGHPELVGQALAALTAVDIAVVVVDAVLGVEPHTRFLYDAAGALGLARMVVVNRIDQAAANLPSLVASLATDLGPRVLCMNLPTRSGSDVVDCFDHDAGHTDFGSVADVHRAVLESSIEVDDALVERYFAGQPIDLGALRKAFVAAMVQGRVVPALFTAGRSGVGVEDLLHILASEGPSPVNARPRRLLRAGAPVDIACDAKAPFIAHVFKVSTDPELGRLAFLRILQGSFDGTTSYVAASDKKPRRTPNILKVEGRTRSELAVAAVAGDLVAVGKVDDLHVDQVLHDASLPEDYAPIRPAYPAPTMALGLAPNDKKDQGKLALALAQLAEEDPTLAVASDAGGLVLRGLGELHLGLAVEHLQRRYHLAVKTRAGAV